MHIIMHIPCISHAQGRILRLPSGAGTLLLHQGESHRQQPEGLWHVRRVAASYSWHECSVKPWMQPWINNPKNHHKWVVWTFINNFFFLDFLKAEFDGGLNGVRVMGRTANHPVVMDEHVWCIFVLKATVTWAPHDLRTPHKSCGEAIMKEDRFPRFSQWVFSTATLVENFPQAISN